MPTDDADEAWWPPTFSPSGLGRTTLASWIDPRREPEDALVDARRAARRCDRRPMSRGRPRAHVPASASSAGPRWHPVRARSRSTSGCRVPISGTACPIHALGCYGHGQRPSNRTDDGAATAADRPMARWLTVLEAYARRPEWGIRDLAAATGLPRSSVHRIVREMTGLGLLVPAGLNGRTEVGPTLMRLAVGLTEHVDVLRAAGPVARGAARRDRRDRDRSRSTTGRGGCSARSPRRSRHTRSATSGRRSRSGASCTSGRAARASSRSCRPTSSGASSTALPDPLPPPSGAPKAALESSLVQAARDGWVISHGERFAGAVGVAAPIRGADGRVVGSVLLGWPDNRTDACEGAARPRARRSAQPARSRRALGYDGPATPCRTEASGDA